MLPSRYPFPPTPVTAAVAGLCHVLSCNDSCGRPDIQVQDLVVSTPELRGMFFPIFTTTTVMSSNGELCPMNSRNRSLTCRSNRHFPRRFGKVLLLLKELVFGSETGKTSQLQNAENEDSGTKSVADLIIECCAAAGKWLSHRHHVWNRQCLLLFCFEGGVDVKTSEDARQSGLYASSCCGEETFFGEGDTLPRCPLCWQLCEWDLVFHLGYFPTYGSLRDVE
jgi:hypothetical protein